MTTPSQTAARFRRSHSLLLAICAALALLADWLFYGHPTGATAGGFTLIAVALLHAMGGPALRRSPARGVTAALLGLVIAMAIYPSALALILATLGVATLAILRRNAHLTDARAWLGQLSNLAVRTLWLPLRDSRLVRKWARTHHVFQSPRFAAYRAIFAWLLPVGLSLVFVMLFAMANPIIESWLSRLGDLLTGDFVHYLPSLGRMFYWLFVALSAYSLLRWRPRAATLRADAVFDQQTLLIPPDSPSDSSALAGFVVRCLVVFNIVFAVQTLLDGWYLVGQAALPEGMTYAQYAHRGAYPLIATALLAAGFVLLVFQPGRDAGRWRTAQRLVYLWLAQNLLLVIAAGWRLTLYIDIYSLSRLRVAAMIWMALVAMGLIWIVVRILQQRSNTWLINVNTLTLLAVLYVCAFVNFDGYIADFNVRHCREISGRPDAAPLDVAYLYTLGPEALPAAQWARDRLHINRHARDELVHLIKRQESQLAEQIASDWRAWCLRRAWLLKAINEHAAGKDATSRGAS